MSELTDRLRGIYQVGPLTNGVGEFGQREFETPPISHEAADKIDAQQQEIDELKTHVERLSQVYTVAAIGSCTCCTKTPEYTNHKHNCKYRLISEAADQSPRQSLQEVKAQAIEKFVKWYHVGNSDVNLRIRSRIYTQQLRNNNGGEV